MTLLGRGLSLEIETKGPRKNHLAILAADASRGPALLVAYIHWVCALLAPWPPGASAPRLGKVILSRALTYRFRGRDFRLTDVHGEVLTKILA